MSNSEGGSGTSARRVGFDPRDFDVSEYRKTLSDPSRSMEQILSSIRLIVAAERLSGARFTKAADASRSIANSARHLIGRPSEAEEREQDDKPLSDDLRRELDSLTAELLRDAEDLGAQSPEPVKIGQPPPFRATKRDAASSGSAETRTLRHADWRELGELLALAEGALSDMQAAREAREVRARARASGFQEGFVLSGAERFRRRSPRRLTKRRFMAPDKREYLAAREREAQENGAPQDVAPAGLDAVSAGIANRIISGVKARASRDPEALAAVKEAGSTNLMETEASAASDREASRRRREEQSRTFAEVLKILRALQEDRRANAPPAARATAKLDAAESQRASALLDQAAQLQNPPEAQSRSARAPSTLAPAAEATDETLDQEPYAFESEHADDPDAARLMKARQRKVATRRLRRLDRKAGAQPAQSLRASSAPKPPQTASVDVEPADAKPAASTIIAPNSSERQAAPTPPRPAEQPKSAAPPQVNASGKAKKPIDKPIASDAGVAARSKSVLDKIGAAVRAEAFRRSKSNHRPLGKEPDPRVKEMLGLDANTRLAPQPRWADEVRAKAAASAEVAQKRATAPQTPATPPESKPTFEKPPTITANDADNAASKAPAVAKSAVVTELRPGAVTPPKREAAIQKIKTLGDPKGALARRVLERMRKETGAEAASLEDVTSETLNPAIATWLDDNLPTLVERLIREEMGKDVKSD